MQGQSSKTGEGTSSGNVLAESSIPAVLSPGYCVDDYQPLAQLCQGQTSSPANPSPPRKRRKVVGKPGKVMKEAYFKGIKWTKTFVTGPLYPVHNKHKFYCQICKTNVSLKSKGAREIIRHFQSESHLHKDQRWRFEYLTKVYEVTGVTSHEVRGKDGHILTPLELEKEKPLFIVAPLLDVGDKYPFYDEYMAGIGAFTNPTETRASMQLSLIGLFVPSCGNVSLLQTLWTRVGVTANHQELFSGFDWGATKLTVSFFLIVSRTPMTFLSTRGIPCFPFQTIFHHILSCAMTDISSCISATGFYSFEFEKKGIYGLVYVQYWKSTSLVRVYMCRYKLTSDPSSGILNSISRVLPVLSSKPEVVCVFGCTVEIVQTLDRCTLYQQGIQYPFRFGSMSLPHLMHQTGGSVFGKIDIFSQVKFLLGSLNGCQELPWIGNMPTLVQVSVLLWLVDSLVEPTLSPSCYRR